MTEASDSWQAYARSSLSLGCSCAVRHVSDRTLDVLEVAVRKLRDDPTGTCAAAGVDAAHADTCFPGSSDLSVVAARR